MNKRKRRAGGFLKNSQLLVPLIATLALVTYVPGIVTWLPNLLLG